MFKWLRLILFPLSFLLYIITSLRNMMYDRGIFKSYEFNTPIICVGNLSTGGTGKTPHTEMLIEILKNKKITVLSRGYKRKTRGFLIANEDTKQEDLGDEPFQISKKFPNINVVVCEDRVRAIKIIEKKIKPDIIILDDGFQHRRVKPLLSIVLTDYNRLFFKDFVLPMGNLRESRRGIRRSNMVIVTKIPDSLSEREKNFVQKKIKKYAEIPIFFSKINYEKLRNIYNDKISLEAITNQNVLLVTGISNTKTLENYLKKEGITFYHIKFGDHHNFSESDILDIENEYMNGKYKYLITTEKDFVRLNDKIKIKNLYFLPIKVKVLEKEVFEQNIYDII